MSKLVRRAGKIYLAHIMTTVVALAIMAAAAVGFGNLVYFEKFYAGAVLTSPAPAALGLLTLSYQFASFNILPLYVALVLSGIPIVLLGRQRLGIALLLSFLLYAASLIFGLAPPSWPTATGWYFNPLSWQFIFILGFAAAELHARGALNSWLPRLQPAAFLIVAVGVGAGFVALNQKAFHSPGVAGYVFSLSTTYETPARLLNMLALAIAFAGAFPTILDRTPRIVLVLCSLGRNSLPIFSIGAVLVLVNSILVIPFHRYPLIPISLTFVGVGAMVFIAGVLDKRRQKARASSDHRVSPAAASTGRLWEDARA